MKTPRNWPKLFTWGAVGFLCLEMQGGELTGTTRDAVSNDGVASVKVKLVTADDKPYKNALTDDSGKYLITGVKAGDYKVFFEKTGFIATPKPASVTLSDPGKKEQDAMLLSENPDAAYVVGLAARIKERARNCPSTVRGYEMEWAAIEQLGISAAFKTRLASAIGQQDEEALKVQAINNQFQQNRPNSAPEIHEIKTETRDETIKKPQIFEQTNDAATVRDALKQSKSP